jgi:hypothetical protein
MGGSALELLAEYVEHVLARLLNRVITPVPQDISIYLGASDDGLEAQQWVRDKSADSAQGDLRRVLSESGNADAAAQRFTERQRLMTEEAVS